MHGKKIILVDSNNLAYRAFYALPITIATSTGTVTNAVFGFTSMLIKLLEDEKPDIIVCAFDSRGPTFRHDIFKEYKAKRKKMPEELSIQIPLIREVLNSLNIESLEAEGYEADDIIATIVNNVKESFDEIIIVSSDKDILQLVSDKIKVMAVKKGITDTVLYDTNGVVEKYGVRPAEIKDLLALMGDASDNIPGVGGIGPKTALELVSELGSIEDIYKNIEKVKSEKLRNLLIKSQEIAKKSKKLTQLDSNIALNLDKVFARKISGDAYSKAEHIFSLLEFNTLKKRLKDVVNFYGGLIEKKSDEKSDILFIKDKTEAKRTPGLKKKIFLNPSAIEDLTVKGLKKIFISNYNIEIEEATGKENQGKFFSGIIIGDGIDNFYLFDEAALEDSDIQGNLAKVFEAESVVKSGFDFKQIFKLLQKFNIASDCKVIDYKIIYLLTNPVKSDVTIEEIFTEILNLNISEVSNTNLELEIFGQLGIGKNGKKVLKGLSPENGKIDQMMFHFESGSIIAEKDTGVMQEPVQKKVTVDIAGQLKENFDYLISSIKPLLNNMIYFSRIEEILTSRLKKENLETLYWKIEEPLIRVLADMEFRGVNIDIKYLNSLIKEYDISIRNLTKEIFRLCDSEFNINSTQQLAQVLYEKLKLQATKKTKTGFSTDAAALFSIYDSHPVIEKILDYREKVKLKNTYIDVLPNLIDTLDKRVHTTYNQLGTTTGRISSNNPNLQNIPVRTELGKQIRKAFIPGKGYGLLLSADYSQIELRILAHLSDDSELIEAFNSGQDIHTRTAAEVFGMEYSMVDENLRRKAKAINFGIIYGMTEFGLKSRLAISEEEAREYIRLYFARYPRIKNYINSLIQSAYKSGFTTTMFGRKRYIRELSSTNANLRNLGERLAVNTPIQGSAADVMKLATVVLFNNLKKEKLDCNIILHVHDELVLEIKEKDLGRVENLVKDSMENCVDIKAKLKVDLKAAKNWYI